MPAVTPRMVRRVLVTLLLVAVFRLGQYVPLPYVDTAALAPDPGPTYAFLDLVSGGGVGRLSVFALGVYPFFFAVAAMNVVVDGSPRLTALAAEGKAGMRRLLFYRRLLAFGIAAVFGGVLVAAGAAGYFGDGAFVSTGPGPLVLAVGCLAAGTAVAMLIAEGIHRYGYGPGSRMLALAAFLAGFTEEFAEVLARRGPVVFAALLAAVLGAVVGRVLVSQAHRRIPIQYAKRMIGRRPGAAPTYVPLHLVGRGDKALLTATVVVLLPTVAGDLAGFGWDARDPWYPVVFALLVATITFVSTVTMHDLPDHVDRLKRTGAFVPGIRPGPTTGRYLGFVLVRLAAAGAVFWATAALLPLGAGALLAAGAPFLALLPVGVFYTVEAAIQAAREIRTEMYMRHYEGFLR